jgi:hypothetical protein
VSGSLHPWNRSPSLMAVASDLLLLSLYSFAFALLKMRNKSILEN